MFPRKLFDKYTVCFESCQKGGCKPLPKLLNLGADLKDFHVS